MLKKRERYKMLKSDIRDRRFWQVLILLFVRKLSSILYNKLNLQEDK